MGASCETEVNKAAMKGIKLIILIAPYVVVLSVKCFSSGGDGSNNVEDEDTDESANLL